MQSSSSSLRTRDVLAAMALLWLSWQTAYNNNENSIAVNLHLAFYIPHQYNSANRDNNNNDNSNLLQLLDVDGDGTPEALALWATKTNGTSDAEDTTSNSWNLQLHDLRPTLPRFSSKTAIQQQQQPLVPQVLLESEPFQPVKTKTQQKDTTKTNNKKFPPTSMPPQPLSLVTGQVLTTHVEKPPEGKSSSYHHNSHDNNERTDQYFCGNDWHDAAEKCGVHCPSGQSTDCPDNERCFADTGCSYRAMQQNQPLQEEEEEEDMQQQFSVYDVMDQLHKTPAGGWPSLFTLWSNGVITMHSLTAETAKEDDEDEEENKRKRRQKKKRENLPALQLKNMWHVQPLFQPAKSKKGRNAVVVDVEDVATTFLDAISTNHQNAGMLIVSGLANIYEPWDITSSRDVGEEEGNLPVEDDDDEDDYHIHEAPFVLALDALTGDTIWLSTPSELLERLVRDEEDTTIPQSEPEQEEVPLLPVVLANRGTTSAARRRSLLTTHVLPEADQYAEEMTAASTANCMHEFRRSILTSNALPYQYFDNNPKVAALHFDHQSRGNQAKNRHQYGRNKKKHKTVTRRTSSVKRTKTSWSSIFSSFSSRRNQQHHQHRSKHTAIMGRPNVIVTHNFQGIQVRSLKNGRSLCHLSLKERTLYHDMNHDGTLDSFQVVTSRSRLMAPPLAQDADDDEVIQEQKWVEDLAQRVTDLRRDRPPRFDDTTSNNSMAQAWAKRFSRSPLCHLLALSGLPTKEELFSVSLCGGAHRDEVAVAAANQLDIEGSPLLVAESSAPKHQKGHDVVGAMNNGVVSRFRGDNGRRVWQIHGKLSVDFPTWHDGGLVVLDRIASERVIPPAFPIVLAGENSVALLGASNGHVLSMETFPEPSRTRPRLLDLNGDGTTDLLVTSTNAVWGYHVHVRTGASIPFRIIVGLLFMGLMLAFLRNQFGPHPGKRSTDR